MFVQLIPLIVISMVAIFGFFWLRWVILNYDYQCANCGAVFSIPVIQALIVSHSFGKKWVQCPNCGQTTWANPVPK